MNDKNHKLEERGAPLTWSLFSDYHAEECPRCETESLEIRRRYWIQKEARQAIRFCGEEWKEYVMAEEKEIRCKVCGFSKKDFVFSNRGC